MRGEGTDSSQEDAVGPFTRLGLFLDEYWPILLVVLGGVFMAFVPNLLPAPLDMPQGTKQWLRASGALTIIFAFALGNIHVYKRTSRANTLSREKRKLEKIIQGFGDDYFDIWRTKLGHIAKTLGFGDQERVSIYRYSDHDRAFYMLGRYSEGPDFSRRGRGVYPDDQGCIGEAWKSGEAVARDLPDPDSEPDKYASVMADCWNIDSETLRKMLMKSRLIFAFALRDRADLQRTAVIVFESTTVDGFDVNDVRTFIDGIAGREIAHLIEVLRPLEPSPDVARSRGF
ncbi:MAG: hypothetical protein GKR94_33070 [Gammaproteobacteria bacterium]|nr:hypothetical protein [Gammaproteobacteria bacterium]